MQKLKTEFTDVIYNATTQMFEARVTVHEAGTRRSYACAVSAPISVPFERAAELLVQDALRRHGSQRGLHAHFVSTAPRPVQRPTPRLRRGLPLGQYGFFRGRAA